MTRYNSFANIRDGVFQWFNKAKPIPQKLIDNIEKAKRHEDSTFVKVVNDSVWFMHMEPVCKGGGYVEGDGYTIDGIDLIPDEPQTSGEESF